jgi:cytochrome c oxidase subunit 1/cytochrome c oxidase subunit I+III
MYHEGLGKVSFWLTFTGTMVTFFPMHILGLLGMPRRNYTYPRDMGWTGFNVLESIGSYVLAAGLVLIAVNLAMSLRRGAPAGNDPWKAPTLEWATSSPPPPYNFAVIPAVSSPYAMWDPEDREKDLRNLEAGVLVLEQGHETPTSTVVDAEWDEVVEMPSDSPWPISLALALSGMFAMLLLAHWVTAGVFLAFAALVLLAWHSKEPQEA